MTKPAPDYSLEREGVSLRDWLWRLLSGDRETRLAAGDVLHWITLALPTGQTDPAKLSVIPDIPGQIDRFERAVREVVNSPDFDSPDFVRKLSAYRLALKEEWLDRCALTRQRDKRLESRTERLDKRIKRVVSDKGRENAVSSLIQPAVVYATSSCEPGNDPLADNEGSSNAGFISYRLVKILDEEFLAAPESIELLLRADNGRGYEALDILVRTGPPAIEFAPRLIDELDQLRPRHAGGHAPFGGDRALASIGRGNTSVVEAVVSRLSHQEPAIRARAAGALEYMETDVCGRESEIVDLLWPMLDREDTHYSAICALASVGRHFRIVRSLLIEHTGPRPARMRSYEGYPEYEYDEVMQERGSAISLMSYFTDYPDECVPVLIDAMETFEEYDPDYEYEGPIERISDVLKAFGPNASLAAVPLTRHLDDEGDFPRAILESIAEMGPSAADALPALEAFRIKSADGDSLPDLTKGEIDRYEDFVGWTIQKIRGPV